MGGGIGRGERAAGARARRGDLALVHGFLGEDERRPLVAWARTMRPYLNNNGEHRYYNRVERLPHLHPTCTDIRLRVQAALGLPPGAEPEPEIGWYLSIIHSGGFVHPHVDTAPEGMRHLRANLFLQTSYGGGWPIVEMTPCKVTAGSLLAFYPNEMLHLTNPARGRRRRIILSFGYLVPAAYEMPAGLTRVP